MSQQTNADMAQLGGAERPPPPRPPPPSCWHRVSPPRRDRGSGQAPFELPAANSRSHYGLRRVDEFRVAARRGVRSVDGIPGKEPVAHTDFGGVARGDLLVDVRHDRPEPTGGIPAGESRP